MIRLSQLATVVLIGALVGCNAPGNRSSNPAAPSAIATGAGSVTAPAWGPETPNFNLEVVLTGDPGFGLVKFRQPNDSEFVVHLDVWVRDLSPNTSYLLQRAVDSTLDGTCASSDWLTLGRGSAPQAIVTDAEGTGRAALWRGVPPLPGSRFDIHFRVVEEGSGLRVLQSGCYQYAISM